MSAKILKYNRRQSVQEIQDGLDEMYKRQAIEARRNEMAIIEAMINQQRERAGLKPLPKKSFIDRAMPYILLAGFFGVIAAAAFVLTMVINYSAGLPLFTAW